MTSLRGYAAFIGLLLVSTSAIGRAGLPRQNGSPVKPGVYACPMHPDVRGGKGETCPRCGMTLTLLESFDYDSYGLELLGPRAPKPGVPFHVRFHVRAPHGRAIANRFETVHERVLHLFVVSHDLSYFAHVHPILNIKGMFDQALVLPRAGAYRLIADCLPTGAFPQVLQKTIVTTGYNGPILPPGGQAPDHSDKVVNGVRIKLMMEPAFGSREQIVVFELAHASTGDPVEDLEPFLAAPGHLLMVSSDLATAQHSHPLADLSTALGPRVAFQVLFPRAGIYRLWVQFQRHGKVLTADFTVNAATATNAARE